MLQDVGTLLTLAIGSTVLCRDGHGGHVHKVVLDAAGKEIRALIVDRGLAHHPVIVPIGHVARADGEHIALDIGTHEVAILPRYTEIDYAEPDPAWAARHGYAASGAHHDVRAAASFNAPYIQRSGGALVWQHVHAGISDQEVPIGRGTKVSYANGQVGHLDRVLVDPVGHALRALVVRLGHVHGKLVRVPTEWVAWLAEDEIRLSIDHSVAKLLPDYQPGDA